MYRPLVLTLAWVLAGSTARADSPSTPPDMAARAWAITDAVLARHVEPPTRQQMLLAGGKTLARAAQVAIPPGFARRVSDLSTPEQLAALLAEILASPRIEADPTAFEEGMRRALPGDRTAPEAAFFDGLLSVVPGGAMLMSEKERKVQESFEGNTYVGIQVALGYDQAAKKPTFQQILEGGPAEHAGARADDVIEEVDGVPVEGKPLTDVVDRLRGEAGTDVLVKFRRPDTGEVFTRPMTRGRLPRATIQGLSPLPGKRWDVRLGGPSPIGYLKVTEVSGSTPSELRAFAEQLESEGARALVLDLREVHLAGFHPTLLLADALLDGGVIGRVKSADGEKVYRAEPDALFRGWPMVVIADGPSLGEVAWLCEALRDNRRATVIGVPSITRGVFVPESVPIPGGEWSVKMATGRMERGDGRPLPGRPLPEVDATIMVRAVRPKADRPPDPYSPTTSAPTATLPTARQQDPLAQAREILEAALKATGR